MATKRDFLIVLWRVAALWSLMFWQGGFLFYVAAVVPTAQHVIGHLQQGFITRHVAVWINNAGAVSLALLALDLAVFADPRTRRRWIWATWLAMVVCQIALFVLHPRMDAYLDPETLDIESRQEFYLLHRIYLWTHTVQWVFAIAFTVQWIVAWRARDRKVAAAANLAPIEQDRLGSLSHDAAH